MADLPERVLSKVVLMPSGCWEWVGGRQPNGYGYTRWRVGGRWKHVRTHRLLYEVFVEPIPEGMEIDHLCGNRACCAPGHLRAVTHAENLVTRRPRPKTGKTHCRNGHEYTDQDFALNGTRLCRICVRVNGRRNDQARRERARQARALQGGLSHRR